MLTHRKHRVLLSHYRYPANSNLHDLLYGSPSWLCYLPAVRPFNLSEPAPPLQTVMLAPQGCCNKCSKPGSLEYILSSSRGQKSEIKEFSEPQALAAPGQPPFPCPAYGVSTAHCRRALVWASAFPGPLLPEPSLCFLIKTLAFGFRVHLDHPGCSEYP